MEDAIFFLSSFFLMSTFNQAQYLLDIRLQMKRLGIGIDAAGELLDLN